MPNCELECFPLRLRTGWARMPSLTPVFHIILKILVIATKQEKEKQWYQDWKEGRKIVSIFRWQKCTWSFLRNLQKQLPELISEFLKFQVSRLITEVKWILYSRGKILKNKNYTNEFHFHSLKNEKYVNKFNKRCVSLLSGKL